MRDLISSFSLPPWLWILFGAFITMLLVKPKVRSESDAFLAHLMGLKPKRRK